MQNQISFFAEEFARMLFALYDFNIRCIKLKDMCISLQGEKINFYTFRVIYLLRSH